MSKLAAVALAVSLAFNAMFAVGYFTARTTASPERDGNGTTDAVAEKLGLNDAQRHKLRALRKEYQAKSQELLQAAQLAQEQLWLKSCDPDADPEQLQQLRNDLFEIHHARRELELAQFGDFLELLTPDQRERVHQRLRRPHRPPHWGPPMRRFDENQDGVLAPEERERALHHMRERPGGFRGGRPGCPWWSPSGKLKGRGPRHRGWGPWRPASPTKQPPVEEGGESDGTTRDTD
jgi:Spy/CpxP family protein refolding chaperone